MTLVYARQALLNTFQTDAKFSDVAENLGVSVSAEGLIPLLRVVEYSMPSELPKLRRVLINTIEQEAKGFVLKTEQIGAAAPLWMDVHESPMISMLLQEVIFQLSLVNSCGSSIKSQSSNEQKVVAGLVPNPQLILWLLDLFAFVCSVSHSESRPIAISQALRKLKTCLFCPAITVLILRAVPKVPLDNGIGLIRILSVLLRDATSSSDPNHNLVLAAQDCGVLQALMEKVYKKINPNVNSFLRALVEFCVNYELYTQFLKNAPVGKLPPSQPEVKEREEKHFATHAAEHPDSETTSVQVVKPAQISLTPHPPQAQPHIGRGQDQKEGRWPMFTWSHSGDKKGILYFLGSGRGLSSYQNPVQQDKVQVEVSRLNPDMKEATLVSHISECQESLEEEKYGIVGSVGESHVPIVPMSCLG